MACPELGEFGSHFARLPGTPEYNFFLFFGQLEPQGKQAHSVEAV